MCLPPFIYIALFSRTITKLIKIYISSSLPPNRIYSTAPLTSQLKLCKNFGIFKRDNSESSAIPTRIIRAPLVDLWKKFKILIILIMKSYTIQKQNFFGNKFFFHKMSKIVSMNVISVCESNMYNIDFLLEVGSVMCWETPLSFSFLSSSLFFFFVVNSLRFPI